MRVVRICLSWYFALAALFPSMFIVVAIFPPAHAHAVEPLFRWTVLGICAPVAIVFAAAWWTLSRGSSSGRGWALAASALSILIGAWIQYLDRLEIFSSAWFVIGIGATGIVAFARHGSGVTTAQPVTKRDPISGDGTRKWLTIRVISGIGTAMAILGGVGWDYWARAHDLSRQGSTWAVFEVLIAAGVVAILHECGHAVAGGLVSMRTVGISLGPLQRWYQDGRPRVQFRFRDLSSLRWHILVAPTDLKNFRQRKLVQVAAGPAVNVITGLVAVALVMTASGSRWEDQWNLISSFASISLLVGILNLVPFGIGETGYSDGAKLYQLRKPGEWTDYYSLLAVLCSSMVSSIRARDFDLAAMRRTAGTLARGQDELFVRLGEYAYFLDCNQIEEAAEALKRAEARAKEAGIEVPQEWASVFAFGYAFVCRDASNAREWWEKAKNTTTSDSRWTTLSALYWIEGNTAEAEEAIGKAEEWARQLPESGFAAGERNAIDLLKAAMMQSVAPRAQLEPVQELV